MRKNIITPIMYYDPSGRFFLISVLIGVTIAAIVTNAIVNDVNKITSGQVYYEINGEEIIVYNSNELSIFGILGYSFWLKYASPDRDFFEGSASGIAAEWIVHNVLYDVFTVAKAFGINEMDGKSIEKLLDSAHDLNIGSSIYSEKRPKVLYPSLVVQFMMNPFAYFYDKMLFNFKNKLKRRSIE